MLYFNKFQFFFLFLHPSLCVCVPYQHLNENLAKLTAKFEKATADKLKCQQEAESTARTISLANRLVRRVTVTQNSSSLPHLSHLHLPLDRYRCGQIYVYALFLSDLIIVVSFLNNSCLQSNPYIHTNLSITVLKCKFEVCVLYLSVVLSCHLLLVFHYISGENVVL